MTLFSFDIILNILFGNEIIIIWYSKWFGFNNGDTFIVYIICKLHIWIESFVNCTEIKQQKYHIKNLLVANNREIVVSQNH
jgi:hypothetical protein